MRPKATRRDAGDKMGGRDKDKSNPSFNMRIKLFTDEVFPLYNITADMKVADLKKYVEFATGIPVHLQRISYLDEGELQDSVDIRSCDIVPGATLHLRVWPTWKELIEAVTANDIDWVFSLGVTANTTYHTPQSDYMTKKQRRPWIEERAFIALFIASHRGHDKLVKRLIDAGASLSATTPAGRTALHVASAQGQSKIVDVLLESGSDIGARDVDGNDALGIAAKYNQDKTCERHLFLFRWQQRAKQTKKSAEPERMAHQFNDSAFPVWLKGQQCQLYFSNILPPSEYEGTRMNSPRRKAHPRELTRERLYGSGEPQEEEYEIVEDEDGEEGSLRLPVIKEERAKPRSGHRHSRHSRNKQPFSYDEWIGKKKAREQKSLDVVKAKKEKEKAEENERKLDEKRAEIEKSQSYETWLENREFEKKKTDIHRPQEEVRRIERGPSAFRLYLRSLGRTRDGETYEDWLDQKEEELGIDRSNKKALVGH
ncbi:uncharacterized protein LOC127702912 isoform X1 [Mytilus californianus]|uniref:uncharacterized protein LOC127702912 isoform X1 n=1 Tax=Mytilus californianus TaxID=6549 RepID=UPI0022469157|nr:uncharacterized protein LOC127702912 isoform X1 [Mytilus californianus]